MLPLTVATIAVITAQLGEGRYRSAADYASTAKDAHLRKSEWSSRLARQHTASLRSALRGIGPSKQCLEVEPEKFVMAAARIKNKKGMPIGFENTSAIDNFFASRELELSTMLNQPVRVDRIDQIVTIALPVSKTDPMALGRVRSSGAHVRWAK